MKVFRAIKNDVSIYAETSPYLFLATIKVNHQKCILVKIGKINSIIRIDNRQPMKLVSSYHWYLPNSHKI